MSINTVSTGELQLKWNQSSDYWYSSIAASGMCADISLYSYIALTIKGATGGEEFQICLQDTPICGGTKNFHYVPASTYFTVTTSYQTCYIPLIDFSIPDLTKGKAIAIEGFSTQSGTIYISELKIVVNF